MPKPESGSPLFAQRKPAPSGAGSFRSGITAMALRRLPVLMGDDAGVVRVSDREFKSPLKTLRTINNQAQDGNGQGEGIHTHEGSS